MTSQFGWLVSYPKSGNTWLRMMLSSLLAGGTQIDINASGDDIAVNTYAEMDEFLGIESSELTAEEIANAQPALHANILSYAETPLTIRKVHDRYWKAPSGQAIFEAMLTRGAVYLVRDPRDVAVSFAHHRGVTIDRIIEMMGNGKMTLASFGRTLKPQLPQPLGSWSQHVTSWIDQCDMPTLSLRYEDLLADPHTCLSEVAECFGIAADAHGIEAAVAATRFELLQTQEREKGFRERRSGSTGAFFRSGAAGGWRESLSPQQEERIIEDHHDVMARFHYL